MAQSSVTLNAVTAVLILGQNSNRKSLILSNESTDTIYIGGDSTVTALNGISIEPGGKYTEDSGSNRMYLGDYYGISATSSAEVRYWERV